MINKKTEKKYFYFVFKDKDTGINEIIKVNKMDYKDYVSPYYPNKRYSEIHGVDGIFANSLSEAMKIDLNFDKLMDNNLDVEDYEPEI